jgi:hypothetical protein
MRINFVHVFDMSKDRYNEVCHYIMYLYNVNHNYYKHEINPVDMNVDQNQDVMEMNEYNQSK